MNKSELNATVETFKDFLESLNLGDPDAYENLTIYPVYTSRPQQDGYSLLDEAVKSGKFVITEVSEGGAVPNLKVENGLDSDVLILDGDILIGAKQNRSVTTTIIIQKKTESVINVNCVEQGRWSYKNKTFSASDRPVYANLRSVKARSVTKNLKESKRYVADQGTVWDNVEAKNASFTQKDRLFKRSGTSAADDLYKNYTKRSARYESAFKPKSGQVGFVALINDKVVGCDIFGNAGVLKRAYVKGLRSYILDAIEESFEQKTSPIKKDPTMETVRFLDGIKKLKPAAFPSTGKGFNIRFGGRTSNGFAVLDGDQVVHLAAFNDAHVKHEEHSDII